MVRDLVFNALLAVVDVSLIRSAVRGKVPHVAAMIAPLAALVLGFDLWGTMRLVAYLAFVHVPATLLVAAVVLRSRAPRTAFAGAILSITLLAVGLDAFILEPRALEVTRFTMTSRKVAHPLRIVVIADIQYDEFGEHERRALRSALDQKPDLVLFTGDYVQEYDPARRAQAIAAMNADLRALDFDAPLGAFAVGGNVDARDWPTIFEGTHVRVFTRSSTFSAADVSLTALRLSDSFDAHGRIDPAPGFHIAFGHSPDYALGDVHADLLVAGHTHGGQVRLPWIGPLLTLSVVPRSWASGATALSDGRWLVVSRGIGMERGDAPRVRFRCTPEIAVIDVMPGS